MNLPSPDLQTIYASLAWATVLAAFGLHVVALNRRLPVKIGIAWMVLIFLVTAVPDGASPAYWLRLAFQSPSGLLVGSCAIAIRNFFRHQVGCHSLPTGLAVGLVVLGGFLYLDSGGWLSLGLYESGFGPVAAVVGLLIGFCAAVGAMFTPHRAALGPVLFASTLFALWRLPTGNVWDAMLDPLLWLWALFTLLFRATRLRAWSTFTPF